MPTVDILLIEDNPADSEYTREVLAGWEVDHTLTVAGDGEAGLERLLAGSPPDLVLLDLNLPRLSGVEVLRRARAEARLSAVCIVVLATSDNERDVLESEQLAADAYITKPIDLDELRFAWFRLAGRVQGAS